MVFRIPKVGVHIVDNLGSMKSKSGSLPSTLLEDPRRNHDVQFCVQEVGDIVYFPARVCHCVLSGPGPTSLLTVTLTTDAEEMEVSNRREESCMQSRLQKERQGAEEEKVLKTIRSIH